MVNSDNRKLLAEIKKQGSQIRQSFTQYTKDEMIPIINGFYSHYLNVFKDDQLMYSKIQLEYFYNLNFFGQHYSSLQTFENLIIEYDKPEIKTTLFVKHPVESKLITSSTYIMYYGLLKNNALKIDSSGEETRRKEFIEPLIKAKSKLSSLYSEYLSFKKTLNKGQLIYCLENLAFCYAQLSRWYEALYYGGLAEKLEPQNINLHFSKYAVLERIQNGTCTNFSKQLILSSLESLNELEKFDYPVETKLEFQRAKNRNVEILKKNKITLESILEHRRKGELQYAKRTDYLKFCSLNKLFLSEHSLHCNCSRSIQDNITIRSSHEHTHIEFLTPFENILETVAVDYSLARKNYFDSLTGNKLIGYQTRFSNIDSIDIKLKIALLKDSFRLCYSIFDTISIAILEALEIDYTNIRKAGNNLKIHFTNIWDDLITSRHFDDNFYLQPLFSISEDIKIKVGGHKEFREIRNAMEHKIFSVITNKKERKKKPFIGNDYYEIEYVELSEKALILLVYTKSLIHSYVYFMRRISISKSKLNSDHK